jgi:hypothetical protein
LPQRAWAERPALSDRVSFDEMDMLLREEEDAGEQPVGKTPWEAPR